MFALPVTRGRLAFALAVPALTLLLAFVVAPLIWIVRVSFYEPIAGAYMRPGWVLDNYAQFLGSVWHLQNVLLFTIEVAVLTTVLTALLAYPLAMYMARVEGWTKRVLMTVMLAPLLIGLVSLSYGWIVIFRGGGILNATAQAFGLIDAPIQYMYNMRGVIILLVYIGVPYMTLTLLDAIERINPSLVEAAKICRASPWVAFVKITLPLSTPGLYAGCCVVFALNFSAFAVPLMVGAPNTPMIGLMAYRQAMEINNFPFAGSIAIIMTVASAVILIGFSGVMNRLFFTRIGKAV